MKKHANDWQRLTIHPNANGGFGLVVWREFPAFEEDILEVERETLAVLPRMFAAHALTVAANVRKLFRIDGARKGTIELSFEHAIDEILHSACSIDKVTHVETVRTDGQRFENANIISDPELDELAVYLLDSAGDPVFSCVVECGDFEPRRLGDWIGSSFGWIVFVGRGVVTS